MAESKKKIMLLEVNLDGLIYFLFAIMFGPPLLLGGIGVLLLRKEKKKAGKVFLILAGVYLLVGLGICGVLLGGY